MYWAVCGGFDEFKAQFTQAAVTLFGSGYAWLTVSPQENKLEIIQTHNAENPLKEGKIPLLNFQIPYPLFACWYFQCNRQGVCHSGIVWSVR